MQMGHTMLLDNLIISLVNVCFQQQHDYFVVSPLSSYSLEALFFCDS